MNERSRRQPDASRPFLRLESDRELLADASTAVDRVIAADSLGHRLSAWVNLIDWARSGPGAGEVAGTGALSSRAIRRWTLLLDFLDAQPDVRARLQEATAEILAETESVNLFGAAGIPSGRGFIAEFSDRVVCRILPQPPNEHDLGRLLGRLYRTKTHAERFARVPPELFSRLADVVRPPGRSDIWAALRREFADGFRLLAARVQAEGLAPKLRARCGPARVDQSPFFLQQRAADTMLAAWIAGDAAASAADAWRAECAASRDAMSEIARRLETDGVSVDIVYGLDAIDRCLTRMELMAAVMETQPGPQRDAALHTLLSLLIAAAYQDRSITHLARSNLQLLSRKIVDRSGKTGEHYIAWTRREYWQIWGAAAGGGFVTTFTAAIKMVVVGAGFALFIEGLAAGLNYAVSFLLLQALGLVLATKQPAMTAAALANILRTHRGAQRVDDLVDYATQICRSQLAAAIANVAVVSVGAFVFSFLWEQISGRPFLDLHEAVHVFETLSPINSGTVWYAALTGGVLWAASLVGGWFDNWAAYHRLPEAIIAHPLGERFGRKRMVRVAGLVSRNIAGWATNVALGFMLGLIPVLGAFFGFPLDVRHVTLSTGTLALACAGLGKGWFHGGWFLLALAGIAVMFVLNLGVSFLLSLYTAARAYDLPRSFMLDFARAVGRRSLARPGDFVLPPRVDAPAHEH
jgi:site-specific recombinase